MKKVRMVGAGITAALWLVLAAFLWFGPRTDISESERRKLEQLPRLSTEAILSGSFMTKFEAFTQDQFPQREGFRQIKAVFSRYFLQKGDNNGIYLAQNQLAKLEYPLNEHSIQKAKEKFGKIYETYLQDSRNIVFAVVPDKGYYLAQANGYPAMDYDKLFAAMAELPWAKHTDITDCLSAESYYRTDTHWRQEAIVPVAEKLGEALGVTVETDYRLQEIDKPFYGVYYGQAALPMQPETLYVLESDLLDGCIVKNYETNQEIGVYDLDKRESRDLYDVFLSGAVSVLTVQNPAAEEGRELIVFRDSFGSSLIPLLMKDYAKVTVLDIRYVPTSYLPNFVDFHGQDVLFLYSTLVLNQSAMLK